MSNLQPIKLSPAFKDYLWGGTKLMHRFNKKADMEIMAESWELSTHKDGESIVSTGEYKGLSLSQYVEKIGKDKLGRNAQAFDYFPILIKYIDAKQSLSVQVHPDDKYALQNEGEYGKTEMWYIVDCEEGAYIYYGFNRNVTKEELEKSIKENTLLEILNKVYVKKGDVYFIPSGTVHAIGAGNLICEIQQNSNSTYRVYDFDRRDANGNARPLHIEQAIAVSQLSPSPKQEGLKDIAPDDKMLAECEYFTTRKINVDGVKTIIVDDSSFRSFVIIDGKGEFTVGDTTLEIEKGDSVFLPAQNTECVLKGNCEVILSYV